MYEQMVFTEPKPEPSQKTDVPVWLLGSLIGAYVVQIILIITIGILLWLTLDSKNKITAMDQEISNLQEEITYVADDMDQAEQSISSMTDTIDAMTATEIVTEEITEEVTEEPATEAPAPVLSSDLYSNEIQIDGVIYTLPFANQSIVPYYSFDMTKYGFENGYVVNPGDSVINTMELAREEMNENFHFRIGLHNYSDQILDIPGNYDDYLMYCSTHQNTQEKKSSPVHTEKQQNNKNQHAIQKQIRNQKKELQKIEDQIDMLSDQVKQIESEMNQPQFYDNQKTADQKIEAYSQLKKQISKLTDQWEDLALKLDRI